jgi:hypothetical protein
LRYRWYKDGGKTKVQRFVVGLSVSQIEPCPEIGTPVQMPAP